jgi:hypothetical protein
VLFVPRDLIDLRLEFGKSFANGEAVHGWLRRPEPRVRFRLGCDPARAEGGTVGLNAPPHSIILLLRRSRVTSRLTDGPTLDQSVLNCYAPRPRGRGAPHIQVIHASFLWVFLSVQHFAQNHRGCAQDMTSMWPSRLRRTILACSASCAAVPLPSSGGNAILCGLCSDPQRRGRPKRQAW